MPTPVLPDVELVVTRWLRDGLTGVTVSTTVQGPLPEVVVSAAGGQMGVRGLWFRPRLDFDCYAVTRQAASNLARSVVARLSDLSGVYEGAQIQRATVDTAPFWFPDELVNNRPRFTFSATVVLR